MAMTVLLNAGPWLAVPPPTYGGIENVVAALVPELRRRGVRVVLATVGASSLPVDRKVVVFDDGQFPLLQQPYNQVAGIAAAHLHAVVAELQQRHDIDLVHDHQEAFGPTVLAALGAAGPPVLHTLHWDPAKYPELYRQFGAGRLFVNGVSASQLADAPLALRARSVGHVHLATPLAAGPLPAASARPVGRHLVVLGRITPYKGQHVAAALAHRLRRDVVLAGPVGPYTTALELATAGEQAATNPDVRYWYEQVAPLVDGARVRWVGSLAPAARDRMVSSAAATLFPLDWEEPGGTAVVESLALGTPVIGYRRGCLPELVSSGRTGWLVEPGDVDALAAAVDAVSRIDRTECRRDAVERFTPARMAEQYLALYRTVLARTARTAAAVPTRALPPRW